MNDSIKYLNLAFMCANTLDSKGVQWLSGRVLDSRPKGRGFEPNRRHCVVSLSKNITNTSKSLTSTVRHTNAHASTHIQSYVQTISKTTQTHKRTHTHTHTHTHTFTKIHVNTLH